MFVKVAEDLIEKEMLAMGVHKAGIAIMGAKASLVPLKIFKVRAPAANIIKQEMLALGGDCATPEGAVTCTKTYVDILLLGSAVQYQRLINKLIPMAEWFNIKAVINDLKEYLFFKHKPVVTKMADGNYLTYEKTRIMGIINATPDSFYAGSRSETVHGVLKKAEQMLAEGADVLDVGGESTRPGSAAISADEEQMRVVPAIRSLREAFPQCILSVDTYHSTTAERALEVGANIINDISAGEADGHMLEVAKKYAAPIILMHMRGTPQTMQQNIAYENVVDEVAGYLFQRAKLCLEKGFTKEKIILDPGIGFAKDEKGNLTLIHNLKALTGQGMPVLLAASRKGFIGKVLGNLAPGERLEGTLATSCQAVYAGAQMVRVHDVAQHVRVIRMLEAILQCP